MLKDSQSLSIASIICSHRREFVFSEFDLLYLTLVSSECFGALGIIWVLCTVYTADTL